MEFFRIVEVTASEKQICHQLNLSNTDQWSNQIFNLRSPLHNTVVVGGIWGEFTLIRNEIMGGVRFALQDCPNALTWTITYGYPPKRDAIVIHMTINRQRKPDEFIEEIEDFLDDHMTCLHELFSMKDK